MRTAVYWLKTNFLKTELELGHCLRIPSEGPCECDLYLNCSRFVTTPAYAPRLRERHGLELGLADDARARGWPHEVERRSALARRLERLLADLGERTSRCLRIRGLSTVGPFATRIRHPDLWATARLPHALDDREEGGDEP